MGFSAGQMASASMALQLGGLASQTFGSYYGAATQKINLGAQADAADANARLAELGAQNELLQGQHQIGKLTLASGQMKSRQRTAMAANGVDLGVGNAAEVQAGTDLMKEVDVQTAQLNAIKGAWGYRAQAVNYQNEAMAARAGAKGINPLMQAGTTLIGGASTVAANWQAYKKAGVWDTQQQAQQAQSGTINHSAKAFKYNRPQRSEQAVYLAPNGMNLWGG